MPLQDQGMDPASLDPASLYIDLLKLAVSEALRPTQSALVSAPSERPVRGARVTSWLRYGGQRLLSLKGYELARRIDIPPTFMTDGVYVSGVPFSGETMIGLKRLDNVRDCVESVLEDQVPGDFIETGVWRGGCAIFMRGILAAHGVADKQVWLADSFSGVPAPDTARYPLDRFSDLHNQVGLAVSREDVEANFRRYGLLDDQVCFIEGWFEQTLPTLAGHRWSLMRLDGDLYQSTMEALVNLYPGLSPGGYCIVDDYGTYPACRQAVEDYRAKQKIDEPIVDIDGSGAFWRRTAVPAVGGLGSLHGAEEPRREVAVRNGTRLERAAPATPAGPRTSC
jgi:hypothetical protein